MASVPVENEKIDFALRVTSSSPYNQELSIEAYCRDCVIGESNLKELLKGAPSKMSSLGPIRELHARISFAMISKLISALGGSISWKIDAKTLSFTIKHPIKVLDLNPNTKEEDVDHEVQHSVRILESKLADIRGIQTTSSRHNTAKSKIGLSKLSKIGNRSSASEEQIAFNVFGVDGGCTDSSFLDSPSPSEHGNPFEDIEVKSDHQVNQVKRILYIGEYRAISTAPMTKAISIKAAQEIINRTENIWSVIIVKIILTTAELKEFIAFVKLRDLNIPIIGNRDCSSGQVHLFDDIVKFPIDQGQINAIYDRYYRVGKSLVCHLYFNI
jgi:hypothetical protein